MASFNNEGYVANQAAQQTVHGSMYNAPVYQYFNQKEAPLSEEARREQLEKLDQRILSSLAFPEMLERRTNVEQPYSSTCRWIFGTRQYQDWETAPSGLLWVKGKPGAGKSTLMLFLHSRIVERRRRNGACLEFFFSARGTELQHTPIGMLRSLLNQLFLQVEDVRSIVRTPFQLKCKAFGGENTASEGEIGSWAWQRVELESLLRRALLLASKQQQITMFIDALDEAGEQNARDVAAYLHDINDRGSKQEGTLKICISSRHYPIASTTPSHEVVVEKHNYDDVYRYIQDQLDLDRILMDVFGAERDAWSTLKQKLAHQAKGIFQWVRLVVPMIEKAILDGQTCQEVQVWLQDVPNDLAAVYQHILTRVVNRRSIQDTFVLFIWTILSYEPMTLPDVPYILDSNDIVLDPSRWQKKTVELSASSRALLGRRVTALSGGLIEVVGGNLAVVHQSVSDFFRSDGIPLLSSIQQSRSQNAGENFSVGNDWPKTIQDCHALLYWTCLRQLFLAEADEMNFTVRTESVFPVSDWSHLDVVSDAGPDSVCTNSMLEYYSWSFVFHHGRECGDNWRIAARHETYVLNRLLPRLRVEQLRVLDHSKHIALYPGKSIIPLYPGSSIIHLAAMEALDRLIEAALRLGAPIDQTDNLGNTPLYYAAVAGNLSTVKLLVQRGADLHPTVHGGQTPWEIIAHKLRLDIIKWVLDHLSYDIGQPDESRKLARGLWTIAIERGNCAAVQMLPRYDVDVNMPMTGDENGLEFSARRLDRAMVSLLVRLGAKIDPYSKSSRTILRRVVMNNNIDVQEADVAQILELLIEAGADVNAEAPSLGSALRGACLVNAIQYMKVLIQHGANVNQDTYDLGMPLQIASACGIVKAVNILLGAGADVNARHQKHGTALHMAVKFDREEIVKLLLDAGVDASATTGPDGTALEFALCQGRHSIALMLAIRCPESLQYQGPATSRLRSSMSQNGSLPLEEHLRAFETSRPRKNLIIFTGM